jgi:hypothetical protein
VSVLGNKAVPRSRLLLAGGLAAAAVVLGLALLLRPQPSHSPPPAPAEAEAIDRAVREELAAHRIPAGTVRTRRVKTPAAGFERVERRVTVPGDFVTVEFNRELNERVGPHGGRSFATERTKENTVSVHVLTGGTVVQTVLFQLDPFARTDTSARGTGGDPSPAR